MYAKLLLLSTQSTMYMNCLSLVNVVALAIEFLDTYSCRFEKDNRLTWNKHTWLTPYQNEKKKQVLCLGGTSCNLVWQLWQMVWRSYNHRFMFVRNYPLASRTSGKRSREWALLWIHGKWYIYTLYERDTCMLACCLDYTQVHVSLTNPCYMW